MLLYAAEGFCVFILLLFINTLVFVKLFALDDNAAAEQEDDDGIEELWAGLALFKLLLLLLLLLLNIDFVILLLLFL